MKFVISYSEILVSPESKIFPGNSRKNNQKIIFLGKKSYIIDKKKRRKMVIAKVKKNGKSLKNPMPVYFFNIISNGNNQADEKYFPVNYFFKIDLNV